MAEENNYENEKAVIPSKTIVDIDYVDGFHFTSTDLDQTKLPNQNKAITKIYQLISLQRFVLIWVVVKDCIEGIYFTSID